MEQDQGHTEFVDTHDLAGPPPSGESRFGLFSAIGAGFGLYTSQWPFMVGLSAVVLVCTLASLLLFWVPLIGQVLLLVVVGASSGVASYAAVGKLRGVKPAFPLMQRALQPPRLLEVLVCGGVPYLISYGISMVLAMLLLLVVASMQAANEAVAALLILIILGVAIVVGLIAMYFQARLMFGAIVAFDVASEESQPFSRLAEGWRLTRGSVLGLWVLQIFMNLMIFVSMLIPLLGAVLIAVPLQIAMQAVAYRALRGEGA